LANWFSIAFKGAFALTGIGAFAGLIFPGLGSFETRLIAAGACLVFAVLNLVSVRHTGRMQTILVGLLLAVLLFFVVGGMEEISLDHYRGFLAKGWKSVFATAGLIFVSFGGLTKAASVGAETRNPTRNLPRGMVSAFVVVILLYVLAVTVAVGVLPPGELSGSLAPLSETGRLIWGTPGLAAVSAAAMIAFITTANAAILSASRAPMQMSRDGLLPRVFRRVTRRQRTPSASILVTTVFMLGVVLFLGLEDLVKTASTMMLLLFISVNLSIIIMRESRIHSYRPTFRSPLYPWFQIAGIVVYIFLILEMGAVPLFITGGFLLLGTAWYLVFARRRVRRSSALMHVVERVTARELKTPTLEAELKEILVDRDRIVEDRFDLLVKDCPVLDIRERVSSGNLLELAARELAGRLLVPPETLREKFTERERQSCTAIAPGIALPHILVEGNGIFQVMLARGREGIVFPCVDDPVYAVFILAGSPDERNFHLRALMAIAQVVQDPGFFARWREARNPEELRNIVLLAPRQRI
ncbi:MAG TPA: amino acid permease, partial [bacterium]|nr:amino acid permease [bacterium]